MLTRRKKFLSTAALRATAEFDAELQTLPRIYGPPFRRNAFQHAQNVAERHILPWLETEQQFAEQRYQEAAFRFVAIGNDFLEKVSASCGPDFARLPKSLDEDRSLAVPSRFTFERLLHVAQPASPLRYLADLTLSIAHAYAPIETDARAYLDYLMEMNSTRVQSDIVNRIQESRGRLEADLRTLLRETVRIAQQAADRARTAQQQGAAAVQSALTRLDRSENELKERTEPLKPL